MIQANNDIMSGIAKVQSYLYIDPYHAHPVNGLTGAPRLFVSTKCNWFDNEISDYYWKKNAVTGEYEDTPMDRADHSMDMIKYMFTNRPRVATFRPTTRQLKPQYRQWREREVSRNASRKHRYA
jgi:hypothetical protein